MNSKIEIPKLLAWRLAGLDPDYTTAQLDADEEELRKILDAPVVERQDVFGRIDAKVRKEVQGVYDAYAMAHASQAIERQPVPFAWVVVSPSGEEFSELQSSEDAAKDLAHDMDGDLHPDHAGGKHEIKAVYATPPELAELQATIARLTAENEALSEECGINDKEIEGLQSALADAESEIERLNGGQGEPVGVVSHRVDEIGQSFEGVIYATPILMGLVEDGTLLYAYPAIPASEDDKS